MPGPTALKKVFYLHQVGAIGPLIDAQLVEAEHLHQPMPVQTQDFIFESHAFALSVTSARSCLDLTAGRSASTSPGNLYHIVHGATRITVEKSRPSGLFLRKSSAHRPATVARASDSAMAGVAGGHVRTLFQHAKTFAPWSLWGRCWRKQQCAAVTAP